MYYKALCIEYGIQRASNIFSETYEKKLIIENKEHQ